MEDKAQNIENKFTYYLGNTMYINVTNRCTNRCKFCIKSTGDSVGGVNLILESEKFTHEDIIQEIKNTFSPGICNEFVFCGYGEPLIKLDIVKNVAKYIKENYSGIPVRINTNGHANLIHEKNVATELVGLIDKVSVSLNAENADLYAEISSPAFAKAIVYESVKNFIKECSDSGIETTATIVSGFEGCPVNIEKCRQIAQDLGANFKVREWLPNGYDN